MYKNRVLVWVVFCLIMAVALAPFTVTAKTVDLSRIKNESTSAESTKLNNTVLQPSLFLPCVLLGDCAGDAPSPFTIQIAGLSEFTPPPGMSREEAEQLRAQEYDKLDEVFPTLVEALRDSGAGWARIYIDWALIQPSGPTDGTWALYDSWLSQVASAGVKMVATISNPPSWAITATNPCSNRISPDRRQDFYSFLNILVNRYKTAPYNIHNWEIMNEPDAIDGYRCSGGVVNYGQHGADYATLLQGANTAVKTADPVAKVLMGGIAYDWFYLPEDDLVYYDGSKAGKFNRYFIDDMVTAGGENSLDILNFHYFQDFHLEWERWNTGNRPTCGYYTMRDPNPNQLKYDAYGLDIVAKGSHFLNRLKTCYGVDKPIWITEVGHHGIHPNTVDSFGNNVLQTRPNDTLDNQARYVFKVYARSLSLGSENITWYALKIIPSVTEDDYQGLLYDDRDPLLENQPKPAFYAFKTLAHELTGARFSSTLTTPVDIEAYAFSQLPCPGQKIIAWYNQTTGTKPYVISSVKSIKLIYRPYNDGSEHLLLISDGGSGDLDKTVNGSITISLSLEPVIIQTNP